MKFAHYLEDTRIPEWKKKYIDFKGLQKQIAVIQHERNNKHTAADPPTTGSSSRLATVPSNVSHASGPPRRPRTTSQDPVPAVSNDTDQTPGRHLGPHLDSSRRQLRSTRRAVRRFPRSDVPVHDTLSELLDTMSSSELEFFSKLDHEADKIEKFYVSREEMAQEQLDSLEGDIKELKEYHHLHRRAPQENKWLSFISDAVPGSSHGQQARQPVDAPESSDKDQEQDQAINNPEDYATARKKLKKDFLEFYRGLELLNDYRVLNETGFHKALKKFDKVTKSISRRLYLREKIEPLRFSNKEEVLGMLTKVEELYADSFEKGSLRRARERLHSTPPATTHHSSTWRSGIFLGLALPAIVIGIRQALRPSVRARVPEWSPLLQVYAMLFIPTAFSLLITLNVLVWAHARINYVFIFALDRRSALDSRQYAQIPAFLMFLLAYAFMFSFTSIWSPTAWPLLWLLFTLVFLFNPLPILTHRARWWFFQTLGRQLRSGTFRVKYADFWIADQLCSLAFPLGNLYFIGCVATGAGGWERAIPRCELTKNPHWPAVFILATLGPMIRLVQCIRRWSDEGRGMHLVNAGKYTSIIVMYLCYYVWRYHGGLPGRHKVIYIVFAAVSAVYTTYWDIVRDWSVVSAWPPRWLERAVAYEFHRWLYPIATVLNVLMRFFWVFYLPVKGPSPPLRTFIVACVEALRRIMWNFFRIENDHVGNTDQFHATKEVPLPYQFQDLGNDDDDAEYRESRFGRAEGQRAVDHPGRFAAVGAVEEK